MSVVIYLLGGTFLALAVICARGAVRALGPFWQVLRHETRPVGELTPGRVEVSGVLRATSAPLVTVNGQSSVAIFTRLGGTLRRANRKSHRDPTIVTFVEASAAELSDASGSCSIDGASGVLIGQSVSYTFDPVPFQERCPALWERLRSARSDATFSEVEVEQTYLPDGCPAFLSGVCEPDAEGGPGRLRIVGRADSPLLAACFSEADVRSLLLRPTLLLAWLSIVLLLVGAFVCALPTILARLAGL